MDDREQEIRRHPGIVGIGINKYLLSLIDEERALGREAAVMLDGYRGILAAHGFPMQSVDALLARARAVGWL